MNQETMDSEKQTEGFGGENEPWKTVDSEKQTEGFGEEGGGGSVSLVVGIAEGTYCMEHWVWCINNESWNTEKIK